MLLNTFGGGSSATASLGVLALSLSSLQGVAFLASPPGSISYQPLYDSIGIPSLHTAFVVEIAENRYFHRTELPLTIGMAPTAEIRTSDLGISDHRRRELEWRRTHGERLQTFSGQWVVLEGEEIIAYGRDPVELVSEAKRRGIRVPYIFFVETQTEEVVRMGL